MSSDEDITDINVSLDELVEKNAQEEKEHIIKANLQNIKFSKSKLRYAQELYYANKEGRSPLTRGNISEKRQPVHARLGKTTRLRTMPVNVSTSTILPKRRILRLNDINTRGNPGKFLRLYRGGQAQLRLERIRRQQAEALQNTQLIQPVNKFRLRRRRLNVLPYQMTPANFTVQIPNNSFVNPDSAPMIHSIQDELDFRIQDEIRRIQMLHSHPPERIDSLPVLQPTISITLDERFSALP